MGDLGVGGRNPIRVQSMTTPATTDTEATVAQIVRLVEAGCEIVRVTVPTSTDARSLPAIRRALAARKVRVPLVADIHFSPGAAMKAVEHVEKIRVNPGNYADRKQFAVREYTDAEYDAELARLEESFGPLAKRAKELGVAMRIGTNHGSLSDRILNRYGDTPLGMVESALEFVRICEAHGYRDLVISMKASSPLVTIQAYRLLAARMDAEGMDYPFHLGVTEAGEGEDGRVKSAIGIGALLDDGIGDTVRVSLTEDPVEEIPVAWRLVGPYNRLIAAGRADPSPARRGTLNAPRDAPALPFDPYTRERRISRTVTMGPCRMGGDSPVRVEVRLVSPLSAGDGIRREIDAQAGIRVPVEARAEIVETVLHEPGDPGRLLALRAPLRLAAPGAALSARPSPDLARSVVERFTRPAGAALDVDRIVLPAGILKEVLSAGGLSLDEIPVHAGCAVLVEGTAAELLSVVDAARHAPALSMQSPETSPAAAEAPLADAASRNQPPPATSPARAKIPVQETARPSGAARGGPLLGSIAFTIPVRAIGADADPGGAAGGRGSGEPSPGRWTSPVHEYRRLAAGLAAAGVDVPIVISCDAGIAADDDRDQVGALGASIVVGSLLCDGIGDAVSVRARDAGESRILALNILQAARVRIFKTEFISCPSCGRTLFDLEETTRRIRQRTGHLKGLKIAIMGCVVNGPGEMADADFGYVGWGAGRIALFVGKEMVARDIPAAEADDRLVDLIKQHGRWQDPPAGPVLLP